jgi:hypothetical protein
MSYRDDRDALLAEIRVLEGENTGLKAQLEELRVRLARLQQEQDEEREHICRSDCLACGGQLLPVAVFSGHDFADPQPIHLSTLRFQQKKGGFTHAAPVHAYACASCGFIQHFVARSAALGDGGVAA